MRAAWENAEEEEVETIGAWYLFETPQEPA